PGRARPGGASATTSRGGATGGESAPRGAKAGARSASGPSATQVAAGSTRRRMQGPSTSMPAPPKRRPPAAGPGLSRPKCSRAPVTISSMARPDPLQERTEEGERLALAAATGLLDRDGQAGELGLDLRQRQEGNARRQDGGLDDGVLGPVEAEEVAQPAGVEDLDLEGRPLGAAGAGGDAELGVA